MSNPQRNLVVVITTALITSAVTALLSSGALAQVHPEKPTYKYEKCYGVARAGMNDCFFSGNSCAGTAAEDHLPGAVNWPVLDDEDPKVRAAAFAALQPCVKDGFGYVPAKLPDQRKEASAKWAAWVTQKCGAEEPAK